MYEDLLDKVLLYMRGESAYEEDDIIHIVSIAHSDGRITDSQYDKLIDRICW